MESGWQASLGTFRQILFEGTFKTAADRHKCDDTLPQKKKKKVAVAF
jgi:hypothetical protein